MDGPQVAYLIMLKLCAICIQTLYVDFYNNYIYSYNFLFL